MWFHGLHLALTVLCEAKNSPTHRAPINKGNGGIVYVLTEAPLPFFILFFYVNQVLQFPPDLYNYITAKLHKQVILVLNKADLCPPPLVIAWKHYMTSLYPHLHMVCFTSHPGQPYSTGEGEPGGIYKPADLIQHWSGSSRNDWFSSTTKSIT